MSHFLSNLSLLSDVTRVTYEHKHSTFPDYIHLMIESGLPEMIYTTPYNRHKFIATII